MKAYGKKPKNKACRNRHDRVKQVNPIKATPRITTPLSALTEQQKNQILFSGYPDVEAKVSSITLAPNLKITLDQTNCLRLFYEENKSVAISIPKLRMLSQCGTVRIEMGLFGSFTLGLDQTQQKLLRDFFVSTKHRKHLVHVVEVDNECPVESIEAFDNLDWEWSDDSF